MELYTGAAYSSQRQPEYKHGIKTKMSTNSCYNGSSWQTTWRAIQNLAQNRHSQLVWTLRWFWHWTRNKVNLLLWIYLYYGNKSTLVHLKTEPNIIIHSTQCCLMHVNKKLYNNCQYFTQTNWKHPDNVKYSLSAWRHPCVKWTYLQHSLIRIQ